MATMKRSSILFFLILIPLAWRTQEVASLGEDATLIIDAGQPGRVIPAGLWGSNLPHNVPAADTVEDPGFVTAARQIGVTFIRWPGGNNASAYDWKRDEQIKPGRRVYNPRLVNLARLIAFVQAIGAEPTITINFGTMSAQDAADLVEFLNGPTDSTWGARRAELGFPDPLNVRYFEIGNEENQPHMWYYSWTAENPEKYFFGGEEERRGFYNNRSSQAYDPVGAKGDAFKVHNGAEQTYTLRFPPVRDVRVLWAASRQDAETENLEPWQQVDDLSNQPPDARVYTLDAENGVLRFGDGIHGAMPPEGSYFLMEYTTYNHDGFLDFAQAMRAAPSSLDIQIGAAVLPFREGQPIADEATMRQIFEAMDFYVRHQYDAAFPVSAYDQYNHRRQIATERVEILQSVYQRVTEYQNSLGLTNDLGIAVTEWNIFLNQDHWHINRTLEGGVIAAEWFIRLLNAGERAPVLYANQFALNGGNLALIRSQKNQSVAPMGYVFQGFADWPGARLLPVTVDSPSGQAYDRPVAYIAASAALSPEGDTLLIALVNNAEQEELTVTLQINDFTPAAAEGWQLTAASYAADNDADPSNVIPQEIPLPSAPNRLDLPPHSITFLQLQK